MTLMNIKNDHVAPSTWCGLKCLMTGKAEALTKQHQPRHSQNLHQTCSRASDSWKVCVTDMQNGDIHVKSCVECICLKRYLKSYVP